MAEVTTLEHTPRVLIHEAADAFGLAPQDLAGLLGTNVRTVERWKTEGTYPQREARSRLAELETIFGRLRETFNSDATSRDWLHRPSPFLGLLSPADAIRAARPDRVLAALEALDSGFAT